VISFLLIVLLSVSSLLAATLRDFRRIILCLWLSQLLLGGLALQTGAVFFTFVIWMLSTVLAGVFFSYSLVFGESILFEKDLFGDSGGGRFVGSVGGGLLSAAVAMTLLWVVVGEPVLLQTRSADISSGTMSGGYLQGLGGHYFREPILSIFLVSLVLMVAVLGVAVLTRARRTPPVTRSDVEAAGA